MLHRLKRFVMTIVGFGLLGLGALMVVLPGPGLLFVVAGLVVLATEYVWARRLLVHAKKQARRVQDAAVASRLRTASSASFAGVLGGLGLFMVIFEEVSWPFFQSLLDRVWGPVSGSLLMLTGVALLTTTVVTRMTAQGEPTTHLPRLP
ncbi:MAG: PGPGW domain-containing protein [Actinomycetes bacterium]